MPLRAPGSAGIAPDPAVADYTLLERARAGTMEPGWPRHLALLVVLLLLTALVIAPLWFGRRGDPLRAHFLGIVSPANDALLETQLSLAAQLAAIRGYHLTGDTLYLAGLREAREREQRAAERLAALAEQLGPEVVQAVAELNRRTRAWSEEGGALLTGRQAVEQRVESLPDAPQRFEAALAAVEQVNAALNRAEADLLDRSDAAVRAERILVSLLALPALIAVLIVGWLAHRLDRLSRQLAARAEQEVARHRLSHALSGAISMQEVAQRAARNALESMHARGAFLERVEAEVVEVVASAGEGTPPPGTTTPYHDSASAAILESGAEILLAAIGEDRALRAPYLAERSPGGTALVAPILAAEGVQGALVVLRAPGQASFGEAEAAHVGALADRVTAALRRVLLLERLRESEARFRQMAENLQEMVWISDPEFRTYYYINRAFERIWRRPLAAMYEDPRAFLESVHPDDRERVERALEGYPRGEYRTTYRIIRADGRFRWIAARASPVRDEQGRIFRIAGTAYDITEQKRAEEEREQLLARERQARTEAEAALHTRDRVLRIVSHDLKNPLHTIGMAAQLLEMPLPEEQRERQLGIIRRSVERANRMVLDLLDAARLQGGHVIAITPAPVEVEPLLLEAAEAFRLQAEEKQQQLACEAAEGIATVLADRDRLLQVLANLLGNAVKFTPEGGHVRLRAERGGEGEVQFSVSDTGPGIPAEILPHLFEPFAQAKDTASLGTGLGLAIASGIVEAHGGRLAVESRPGAGTTFRFSLPTPHLHAAGPVEVRAGSLG